MSTWTSKTANGKPDFSELFKEEFMVLFLRGKNTFGDQIYSYVKVSVPNIKRLHDALYNGENFTPSDFGEVVAAGRGEPSEETKAELALAYPILGQEPLAANPLPAAPVAKKAWDEY
jgi:hypothetical protein